MWANWFKKKRPLVYDLGVNHGEDSRYYLAKGFRVVGVEASPTIAAELVKKFAREIESGAYTLLNIGIWSEETTLPFYHNEHNDDWSSFDEKYGTRNGTPYKVEHVKCWTMGRLLATYGTPYYLKIDIEGADKFVIDAIAGARRLPPYISIEEFGVEALDDLRRAGYAKFHLAPQQRKVPNKEPSPSAEGITSGTAFDGDCSGVFGKDIPAWDDYETTRSRFLKTIRAEDGTWIAPSDEWYDIHASR